MSYLFRFPGYGGGGGDGGYGGGGVGGGDGGGVPPRRCLFKRLVIYDRAVLKMTYTAF